MSMSDETFWRIIELLDWKKTGNDDAVVAPVVKALSQMSVDDIERFEEILAKKLYALDTERHAREIGEAAYDTNKYFSPDVFLYARCVVVANGPALYAAVLENPKVMPKDMDFEAILYVAESAYERKTGGEFVHVAPTSYETFSNKDGW